MLLSVEGLLSPGSYKELNLYGLKLTIFVTGMY